MKIKKKSNDPWLFVLDWNQKEIKLNKKINKTSENNYLAVALNLPKKTDFLFKIFSEKEKISVKFF